MSPMPEITKPDTNTSAISLLLIDDEADNGSVDTGEQTFDSERQPRP
jgi:hypothetical protein